MEDNCEVEAVLTVEESPAVEAALAVFEEVLARTGRVVFH